jgi:hypothetical protein
LRHRRGTITVIIITPYAYSGRDIPRNILRILLQINSRNFRKFCFLYFKKKSQKGFFFSQMPKKKRKEGKKTSTSKPLPSRDGGTSGHISKQPCGPPRRECISHEQSEAVDNH